VARCSSFVSVRLVSVAGRDRVILGDRMRPRVNPLCLRASGRDQGRPRVRVDGGRSREITVATGGPCSRANFHDYEMLRMAFPHAAGGDSFMVAGARLNGSGARPAMPLGRHRELARSRVAPALWQRSLAALGAAASSSLRLQNTTCAPAYRELKQRYSQLRDAKCLSCPCLSALSLPASGGSTACSCPRSCALCRR